MSMTKVTSGIIDTVDASKITGAMPAIDGSALTGIEGGGKLLQVVSTSDFATNQSCNTSTGNWTYLVNTSSQEVNLSITPSSTSSKIIATLSTQTMWSWATGSESNRRSFLLIAAKIGSGGYSNLQCRQMVTQATSSQNIYNYFDDRTISTVYSPNTTEAVTFRIGGCTEAPNWKVNWTPGYGCNTNLVLQEIGA